MSKAQTIDDERKRTLYISSENVDYYAASDRVSINLNQPIAPEEGHILAYSLKSIGLNSTAFNISESQKNNKISYLLEYDTSAVTYIPIKEEPDGPITEINSVLYSDMEPTKEYTITITIPDGNYTLNSLLEYLSTDLNKNIVIPTGYYFDYEKDLEDVDNIVPLRISWIPNTSGYTVGLITDFLESGLIRETYNLGVMGTFTVKEFFSKLISVSIIPTESFPKLYNTLFTNLNTQFKDTPISMHSSSLKRGLNPPLGIKMTFDIADDLLTPDQMENINILEIGNEKIYDTANRIYPTNEKINFHVYKAYYKPVLDPTYVDVVISLPNSAMDERGVRNILTRIFPLGSQEGGSSFFQAWDNPKITVLKGLSGFSNITIEFESQEHKWNFFNLEFHIELEFSEISEKATEDVDDIGNLSLPVTDPIADVSSSVGQRHPKGLPSNHFSYRTGGLQTHKKTRYL